MKAKITSPQDWIKSTLSIAIIILVSVVAINYINDPLWVFNHKNFSNKSQLGFNERQQKSNRLYFSKNNYDSILVGNSKSTYINQHNFKKGNLFNYAVSAMDINEYEGYIDFFTLITGSKPKNILFGIDFNACLENINLHSYESPSFYTSNSSSNLYAIKHLLSYNTFLHTLRNIFKTLDKEKAIYSRDNIKIKKGAKMDVQKLTLKQIKNDPPIYIEQASYNHNLIETLKKIKNNNQESTLIAILLPDFIPSFTINKNRHIYNKCVNEITNLLGSRNIFNFMKLNKDTINPDNYYDASHFRSEIGDKILKEVSSR